ncbi:TPA: hypothetical protein JD648_RS04725 [Morganella morganii]|nr:hypothetical protein [Morganella morganii]
MINKYLAICCFFISGSVFSASDYNESIAVRNISDALINSEIKTFTEGGVTALFESIPEKNNSSDIIRNYHKNELSANKKYLDKKIRVSGRVSEIKSSHNDGGIVEMSDTSIPGVIQLQVDANSDYILSLSSGDFVDIVCVGDKYQMSILTMKECMPTKDLIKNIAFTTKKSAKFKAASYAMFMANEDILMSECIKNSDECEKKLLNLMINEKDSTNERVTNYINNHKSEIVEKFGDVFH